MRCAILLLLLVSQTFARTKPDEELLRIKVNGKIGFINLQGKVVIEPKFKAVGHFVDGLAPARVGGRYGYIDKTGKFVIPDSYDYAKDFSDGYGIINLKDRAGYMSKEGVVTMTPFRDIRSIHQHIAVVENDNGLLGLLDLTGRLIADTIYKFLYFKDSVFVADEGRAFLYSETHFDINGRSISNEEAERIFRNIHRAPRIRYGNNWKDSCIYLLNDSNRVLTVLQYYLSPKERSRIEASELVSTDIGETSERFLIVKTTNGQSLIDTNGLVLIPPTRFYLQFTPNPKVVIGTNYDTLSIFNIETGSTVLIPSAGSKYYFSPEQYAIYGLVNDSAMWIAYDGRVIWQGDRSAIIRYDDVKDISHIESDQYSYIVNLKGEDFRYIGEDSSSFRIPDMPARGYGIMVFDLDTIKYEIHIEPEKWEQQMRRLKIVIYNSCSDTLFVNASFRSPDLVMQALDEDNIWRDIEENIFSLANNYDNRKILPNTKILIAGPLYTGSLKTKLRLKLRLRPSASDSLYPAFLFSNIFDGSINPGQFWRHEHGEEGIHD